MMNEKTVWESYTEEEKKKVYDFCEEYRTFLSKCKTERECVQEILKEAKEHGYRSLKEVRQSNAKLQAGDKVAGTVPYRKRTNGEGHEHFRRTYRFSASGSETESAL